MENNVAIFPSVKEGGRSAGNNYAHSINGRALLTTYENSGMEWRCSEYVGAGPDGYSMGEPTDNVAFQQSKPDEIEHHAAAFYTSHPNQYWSS